MLDVIAVHAVTVVSDDHPVIFQGDPHIVGIGVPSVGYGFADDGDEVSVQLASQMVEYRQ